MSIEYKDFIGIYSGVYPEGFCEHVISEFDRIALEGAGSSRLHLENAIESKKNDHSIFINGVYDALEDFEGKEVRETFYNGLQRAFEEYTRTFSVVLQDTLSCRDMRMQRTPPGGGYHIWHAEQSAPAPGRVLVYMLYLNTLAPEEGGETEFLYQKLRIRPEKNTMLIWPASFTHAHRGGLVMGPNNKYVITGWFNYE